VRRATVIIWAMPIDEGTYAIGDLAALAGTTARTIRYYVAQGLLPAPVGVGPGAHYTNGHLARLRLIRRLQRQHQPLSEIRQRLASLGEDQIAALLAEADRPEPAPADSALDYVRSILGSPSSRVTETFPLPTRASLAPTPPPVTAVAPEMAAPPSRQPAPGGPPGPARLLRAFAAPRPKEAPAASSTHPDVATIAAEAMAPYDVPEAGPGELRSQWDRVALTPNIEIHVRRPLSRLENRRVERLITIARQVLREEPS
jgi:DNA-binding transcriptional MerR regulator